MSTAQRILVPVGDSVTIRQTVAYVARKAADSAGDAADAPALHFVVPVGWQRRDLNTESAEESAELLERIRSWVHQDLGVPEGESLPITLTTEIIGEDEFLFSPRDYASELIQYARENELDHVVLDPEYQPTGRAAILTPLVTELDMADGITYEEAPVERQISGRRLYERAADLSMYLLTFAGAFLFYQLIGGFAGRFDYITGAISAGIVAAVLSGITFERHVNPVQELATTLRWLLYIPFLFWEITKANLEVVYIVLHPSMPIDPGMEEFNPAVPHGLPVTTLANSITLTPGTVTVDIREGRFYIHSLTQSAREGIYEGTLERAVRFVFFGRAGASIASPRERGDAGSIGETDSSRPAIPDEEDRGEQA